MEFFEINDKSAFRNYKWSDILSKFNENCNLFETVQNIQDITSKEKLLRKLEKLPSEAMQNIISLIPSNKIDNKNNEVDLNELDIYTLQKLNNSYPFK